MSAYLDKYGKPTDDVQNAGDFDHDAHMQKVNDYIEKMTDDEIETVIRDSNVVNDFVNFYHANGRKNKLHQGMKADELLKLAMVNLDAELIAYAERNI